MDIRNSLKSVNNVTSTTNGDKAYKSTFNKNLDLFYAMGAMSPQSNNLEDKLEAALLEDRKLALANLMYLRDIRGGIGQRDLFRQGIDIAINDLVDKIAKFNYDEDNYPAMELSQTYLLITLIPEIGRWDDMLVLINTNNEAIRDFVIDIVKEQLDSDLKSDNPSLLGKWMPSENTSSVETKRLARKWIRALKLTPREYRKTLTELRRKIKIVENNLREGDYSFDYDKIPARAFNKYTKSFKRNDSKRFTEYMEQVTSGDKEIKTDTLYPYEIIGKVRKDPAIGKAMWESLTLPADSRNTLVVRDGSGSMTWNYTGGPKPLDIADSLTLLFAENLTGPFKDSFITFSRNPVFVELSGDICDRLKTLDNHNDASNTDLDKTFQLLFEASRKANKEDYIERIVIVSDMQFDRATVHDIETYYFNEDLTDTKNDYDSIVDKYKMLFKEFDIPFPEIVFWNINDYGNIPVEDEKNVKLISGFSTSVLESIINDDTLDANEYMLNTLKPYLEALDKGVLD